MAEPLYQIVLQYHADLAKLQELDLPPEVVLDTIDAMQGDVQEKIRAVVAFALEFERAAEAREAEAKRMAESADSMARRADSLKTYAQIWLMNSGLKLPLVCPEFTLNLAKLPPAVDVPKPDDVPGQFVQVSIAGKRNGTPDKPQAFNDALSILNDLGFEVEVTKKPMKKPIGDALKAGAEVPGAKLAPTAYRMTVR